MFDINSTSANINPDGGPFVLNISRWPDILELHSQIKLDIEIHPQSAQISLLKSGPGPFWIKAFLEAINEVHIALIYLYV